MADRTRHDEPGPRSRRIPCPVRALHVLTSLPAMVQHRRRIGQDPVDLQAVSLRERYVSGDYRLIRLNRTGQKACAAAAVRARSASTTSTRRSYDEGPDPGNRERLPPSSPRVQIARSHESDDCSLLHHKLLVVDRRQHANGQREEGG